PGRAAGDRLAHAGPDRLRQAGDDPGELAAAVDQAAGAAGRLDAAGGLLRARRPAAPVPGQGGPAAVTAAGGLASGGKRVGPVGQTIAPAPPAPGRPGPRVGPAPLLHQIDAALLGDRVRLPLDVDAAGAAQVQQPADVLRADVGHAAVAADVE